MAETIIFNGIKFRRYPESRHRSTRVYYRPGGTDAEQGIQSLHQEVWKAANGPIPTKHDIHHRDKNPLNNNLSNLECLPESAHHRIHARVYDEQAAKHLAAIRPLAAQWHASEIGREWHRQHARKSWNQRMPRKRTCAQCGNGFESTAGRSKFCTNACKSKWRRGQGLDDIVKICQRCSVPFKTNKYENNKFCSRRCAVRHKNNFSG